MLLTIFNWLFDRKIYGLFIGSQIIMKCHSYDLFEEYSIEEISNFSSDYEDKILDTFRFISKKHKRWRGLRIMLCQEYDTPKMSDSFRNKIVERFNLELYMIKFNMCLAIGMGLNVTDLIKSIVIIISDNYIHGFIVFAGSISNEIKIENDHEKPLQQAINNLAQDLKKAAGKDIPDHFLHADFSQEEISDMSKGWRSSSCNQLNIVLIANNSLSINESIAGFNVVVFNDLKNYMKVGLQEITKSLSNPVTYEAFMKNRSNW